MTTRSAGRDKYATDVSDPEESETSAQRCNVYAAVVQALDPQAGIDDGAVVGGHAARAGRVEDGAAALARELQQVVVGLMIVLRFALQF